jgi:hypothetical protein
MSIAIYFIGVIVAYFYMRTLIKRCTGEYTVGDRAFCLLSSSLSFGTVFGIIVFYVVRFMLDNDKPARW